MQISNSSPKGILLWYLFCRLGLHQNTISKRRHLHWYSIDHNQHFEHHNTPHVSMSLKCSCFPSSRKGTESSSNPRTISISPNINEHMIRTIYWSTKQKIHPAKILETIPCSRHEPIMIQREVSYLSPSLSSIVPSPTFSTSNIVCVELAKTWTLLLDLKKPYWLPNALFAALRQVHYRANEHKHILVTCRFLETYSINVYIQNRSKQLSQPNIFQVLS